MLKVVDLLNRYPIISDQITPAELRVILRELQKTLANEVPGDVVELGCYTGTTSLFLQRTLRQQAAQHTLHVYDSFAGLPPKTTPDVSPSGEQFVTGELRASKATFITNFKHAGLPLPIIHKAWFADLRDADMPQQIAFAFLDGDFYESIGDSLRLVWPHLAQGSVVVVDDYQAEALPGARRAVDDWLRTQPARLRVEASLAIIEI